MSIPTTTTKKGFKKTYKKLCIFHVHVLREREPFETAAVKRFIAIALKIEQENFFNKNLLKKENLLKWLCGN